MMSETSSTSAALESINVSVPEAARILGCSRAKFYQLLGEGHIRAVRLGKRTLIPVDAIREFSAKLPAYL